MFDRASHSSPLFQRRLFFLVRTSLSLTGFVGTIMANVYLFVVLLVTATGIYYLYPYFITHQALRRIPAPFPAQFSNLWLLSACRRGKRYRAIDQVHRELGPVVRIQPNHISIADDSAIQAIYGHGNGLLKAYSPPWQTYFQFVLIGMLMLQ